MDNYGHQNMCNLIWHIDDYYSTSEGLQRAVYYDVVGLPTVWFDGAESIEGTHPDSLRYWYEQIITNHLEWEPYVAIDLSGSSINETGGTVNIHLMALEDITAPLCKVWTVIYQKDVVWGEHWLVRDVLDIDDLTITSAGETQDIVKPFVIDQGWYGPVVPKDVGVAVFVESQSAKTVLNACDLSKVDVEITPETATVPRGTDLEITVHLTNITPWAQPVRVWLDVVLPNGNEFPGNPFVGPYNLNLRGGAEINYPLTISVPGKIPAADYRLRLAAGDQANAEMDYEYEYMTVTVTP